MSNCPICKSDNQLELGFSQIGKHYLKKTGNMTTEGQNYYTMNEFLCLECGNVHKKMNEANLKKYLEDRPYFK